MVLYRAKTRVKLTIILVNFRLVVNPELEGFLRLVLTYRHPKCSLTLVVERDASDVCVCGVYVVSFLCLYACVYVCPRVCRYLCRLPGRCEIPLQLELRGLGDTQDGDGVLVL